ncbi:MAG: ATP phosphoribosyltransferase [Flavobacteriales bacterium CG03_land_8_20_14_0_80_35_15]|nr:ATP phosphoribosyltransferase [Zetaproteobacteria bacterium]NDK17404.1 ATP phosphoribosyltransferase [Flavobacteriales bacterium]OIO10718.1 MAG: ATP phosphoribosyltransferase [Flavobacteriaceae bacterium CG1_02_35_72]PIV16855.1 MAG: ATP phosphoribosyltransferase [Flavobacteriales bacterium CG03_land_8_20_14_0_80_35_15]PIX07917.1 MAG: ATP phosphoribosyltransferase [Flavobacteriales bacterium CG_4_8_14_3_um_filter_35_10]
MKTNLKIAIQKSGRLQEDSLRLLDECGIAIDNGRDQLKAKAINFPAEILFLRNSDIPQYLEDGVVDCAIIGENTLIEENSTASLVEKLGFSKCRLSIAVPKTSKVSSLADLDGMRIATSYSNTLSKFMVAAHIEAKTHHISGSVEIAPNIGLADAICDLVSSGSTLFKNNLKEVEVLLKSEAVLAKSPVITKEAQEILDKIQFRIQSVLKARNSRYVLMNVPNDKIDNIVKILPGMRSPTVLPLAQKGWSSIHTVINKGSFWEVIDALKAQGAEGILVVPIEKMVI